mmetsp:Transcript_273/g.263  ORF Transcript_273/g.263 Transcript_273/m.263 type:complete len:121 (-) Transcript_273:749-1111(-)
MVAASSPPWPPLLVTIAYDVVLHGSLISTRDMKLRAEDRNADAARTARSALIRLDEASELPPLVEEVAGVVAPRLAVEEEGDMASSPSQPLISTSKSRASVFGWLSPRWWANHVINHGRA